MELYDFWRRITRFKWGCRCLHPETVVHIHRPVLSVPIR